MGHPVASRNAVAEQQLPGIEPETVVLLHGSTGSSALWRRTAAALQPLYRAVAPDLIGYGSAAGCSTVSPFELDAEAQRIEPLLPSGDGDTYHLVGYSYGGAVALHLALADPGRIGTLTLIEPVFFAALRYAGETEAYGRLCGVRDDFSATLARGERSLAMQHFIDFWTGDGSWAALSANIQGDMLKMADKIVLDWEASFAADPGPERLADLGACTLLVRGEASPDPMCRLVDALHRLMPGSVLTIVSGANHLLPLTHTAALNSAILERLHVDAERRLR